MYGSASTGIGMHSYIPPGLLRAFPSMLNMPRIVIEDGQTNVCSHWVSSNKVEGGGNHVLNIELIRRVFAPSSCWCRFDGLSHLFPKPKFPIADLALVFMPKID
jgi:hypothetical protein